MSSYRGAYDAGLPCKNPSCKSHGKPHPNCQCYGDMSGGGEVDRFCSQDRIHNGNCEYFFDGGIAVPAEDLPSAPSDPSDDNKTVPNDDLPHENPENDASVPSHDLPGHLDDGSWKDYLTKPMMDAGQGSNLSADQIAARTDSDMPEGKDVLGMVESFAKGVAGPIITGAELGLSKLGIPGMSAVDQRKRDEEASPANVAAEAAGAFYSPAAWMRGAGAIKNGLMCAGTQAMDEASKSLLGEGDPQHGAAAALLNIGAAGLLCAAVGSGGARLSKWMKPNSEALLGERLKSTLSGAAIAAKYGQTAEREAGLELLSNAPGFDMKSAKRGVDLYNNLISNGITAIAGSGVIGGGGFSKAYKDYESGADPLDIGWDIAQGVGMGLAAKGISRRVIAPITLKLLSTGVVGNIAGALDHGDNVYKGFKSAIGAAGHLFGDEMPLPTQKMFDEYGSIEKRVKLEDFLGDGGPAQQIMNQIYGDHEAPQGLAEGGMVNSPEKPPGEVPSIMDAHESSVAQAYPEQNLSMNMAKGRISNYLNSLRPNKNQPKLAFDSPPDLSRQQKTFHKALDLANCPLGIMKEIKNGTIEADHVKHINVMYPEVHDFLKKTLTDRITKAQMAGEKPPYKIRQGLSLLMGTSLSSELSPQNIQAAQASFAQAAKPSEAAPHPQGTSSQKQKLTKSDQSYLTGGQALQKRAQKV